MPVITTVTDYPDQSSDRASVAKSVFIEASRTCRQAVASDWSFLEAVTWIATLDHEMVSGLAPCYVEHAVPVARLCQLDEPMGGEFIVASMMADAIAEAFCQCARRIAWPACVYDWNQLSAEEREVASRDDQAKNRSLYRSAHTRNCTCFEDAARALFSAAARGDVVATALPEGAVISRLEWVGADYDLMKGLRLANRQVELVSFPSATILQLWPSPAQLYPKPKGRGRPGCNEEAVRAAFERRRAQNVPLERLQVQEWRLCVADAKALGAQNLAKPETYTRKLGRLYRDAQHAEKL